MPACAFSCNIAGSLKSGLLSILSLPSAWVSHSQSWASSWLESLHAMGGLIQVPVQCLPAHPSAAQHAQMHSLLPCAFP